jgi:serine protease Do
MRNHRDSITALAALLLVWGLIAEAQGPVSASRRNALVNAIEKAAPSVVTINVVEIRAEQLIDPFFQDFWGLFDFRLQRPRVRGRAVEGIGTGFIFDRQGHILTNYHVLQNADMISSVTMPGGRILEVELVGVDRRTDLAVLRAKGDSLPFAPLGSSDDLMVGEWVIAIGNPFGSMMSDSQPSVSVGVISACGRRVKRDIAGGDRLYQGMIQTDAAINPGNSGGPLVNADGNVIGVNTMIFSNSGGYQGLGFAIPASRARRVAEEIIQFGRRRDPWMGFRGEAVETLSPSSLRELGVKASTGVLVTEILRDCPANRAGMRLGDVVLEINGEKVNHPSDVDFINWDLFVGDQVHITIDRQGESNQFNFSIQELTSP